MGRVSEQTIMEDDEYKESSEDALEQINERGG